MLKGYVKMEMSLWKGITIIYMEGYGPLTHAVRLLWSESFDEFAGSLQYSLCLTIQFTVAFT